MSWCGSIPLKPEALAFIKYLLHQIIHGTTSLCFRDQWWGGTRLLSGRIQRWLHNGNNHLPVKPPEVSWVISSLPPPFFHCSDLPVLSFRMAKWCWEGRGATSGKVCRAYQSPTWKTKPQNILLSLFSFPFGLTLGQVISAPKEDIIRSYYPGYFMQSVERQIQTKQVQSAHDDSYQGERILSASIYNTFTRIFICFVFRGWCPFFMPAGYSVAVGEFSGDQVEGESLKRGFLVHLYYFLLIKSRK